MFVDDDGSVFLFWHMVTSFGGMGFAQIDPTDMHTLLKQFSFLSRKFHKAFEAAYPIKKDGSIF